VVVVEDTGGPGDAAAQGAGAGGRRTRRRAGAHRYPTNLLSTFQTVAQASCSPEKSMSVFTDTAAFQVTAAHLGKLALLSFTPLRPGSTRRQQCPRNRRSRSSAGTAWDYSSVVFRVLLCDQRS
jgi:hypothetical protein